MPTFTNSTYTENYTSLVLGILNINDNDTRTIYLYNNGDGDLTFGVQGSGIIFDDEWIEVKCDDATISYTTMTGSNTINCGTWTGYRSVDIKITTPSTATITDYTTNVVLDSDNISGYIGINQSIDINTITKRAIFGIGEI